MKYYVDGWLFDSEEVIEYITEREGCREFDAWLDEEYGEFEICGCSYSASAVWANVDPDSYFDAICTFLDEFGADVIAELESIEVGESKEVHGCHVEATYTERRDIER